MVNILLQHGEDVKAIAALEWLGRQGELPIEHTALLAQLHAQNGTIDLARPWFDQVKKDLKLEIYPQYLRAIEAVLQLSDSARLQGVETSIRQMAQVGGGK